jgi:hypothetical protein
MSLADDIKSMKEAEAIAVSKEEAVIFTFSDSSEAYFYNGEKTNPNWDEFIEALKRK